MIEKNKKTLIFDWGDTLMRDFALEGPMWQWERVEGISGIKDALKALHPNYRLVVATSADHSGTDDLRKALERIGVDVYFDQFFAQKDLGYKKPDARFFKSVVNHLNESPENCIMIGNSYEKDIIGAKASGLKTLLFNENRLPGPFPDADRVFFDMKVLHLVVDELE